MKTLTKILVISVTALLFVSCQDDYPDEMYTRINADGSCFRDIEVYTDSAYYAGNRKNNPFPFKPDSSWSITSSKEPYIIVLDDSIQKHHIHYRAKASKEYPVVDDLAKSFYFDDDEWDSLVPKISYRQKFQWFYTYYDFTETYSSINQLMVPITDYLNEEEVATWFGENASMYKGKNGVEINDLLNNIEYKVNAWYNRNYYEVGYNLILKNLRYFINLPIDSLSLAMAKDTIYRKNKKYIESADLFEMDFEKIIDKHFQTTVFSSQNTKLVHDTLDNKSLEFISFFDKRLKYGLSLPGKVIETNAPFKSSDTLSWNFDAYRFFINDYSLTAKSRKTNYWAFIVTGIIIAFSVIGFRIKKI